MTAIDTTIRGGKYQPVAAYETVSGGNAGYSRPAASAADSLHAVVAALIAAGFVRTAQIGGNWVHLQDKLQARICESWSSAAPAGEIITGTIGVEIWDEPNAEQLV